MRRRSARRRNSRSRHSGARRGPRRRVGLLARRVWQAQAAGIRVFPPMRVIAGQYGGRRLRAPAGAGTRPTSERVREAVFSSLGSLEGARVLDLFAGSGALGIEAMSRGGARVTFVELAPSTRVILMANLEALGIAGLSASVRGGDARTELRRAAARGETYDLAFLDPPYRQAGTLGPVLAPLLAAVLAPGARVVCESDRRQPVELGLPVGRERRYGDTLIRVYLAPSARI